MSKRKLGSRPMLIPLPVVIVGVQLEERINYLTVSYAGMLGDEPPVIAVGIGKQALTYDWIHRCRGFSVNIPSRNLVVQTDYIGMKSGREIDKSQLFDTFYGELGDVPMIRECPVNMECRIQGLHQLGDLVACLGEIVETHVDERCLEREEPDPWQIDPMVLIPPYPHYVGLGEIIAPGFEVGSSLRPPSSSL